MNIFALLTLCALQLSQLPVEPDPAFELPARAGVAQERLGSEPPVAVQGLAGAWCVTAVARGKAALIHIITSG